MGDDDTALAERLRECGAILLSLPGSETTPRRGLFHDPVEIITACRPEEVVPAFARLEEMLAAGCCAAGFVAYEAAPAFDPEMQVHADATLPLLQWAVYDRPPEEIETPYRNDPLPVIDFVPELDAREYARHFDAVHAAIVAGSIYQANLTFRCRAGWEPDPARLFLNLLSRHPAPCAAYLHLPACRIVSLSPELFLESDGGRIFSSPMKGTARRHPAAARDREVARGLAKDAKNRAENLMIVDMVRNDLGRICRTGSIAAEPLFHVDTYRTVHQLVSTVHGELRPEAGLFDIFQATFPPASITGAPKISAMRVIREQETSPRQLYTGAIGCFFPNRVFRLNVAIRTLCCTERGVETGIGGGVVFDSDASGEWQEALLKKQYANCSMPDFEVFETMRWSRTEGFVFREEHIQRALASQQYFGRNIRMGAIESALDQLLPELECHPEYRDGACVKFLLDRVGRVRTEATPPRRPDWAELPLRVRISRDRTCPADPFLYHKTTHREFYDTRLRAAREEGWHEVLFFNGRDELTEGAISNVFLRRGQDWFTPASECGLLPGIWRAAEILRRRAREVRLARTDLANADEIIIGNSLRGEGRVAEWACE